MLATLPTNWPHQDYACREVPAAMARGCRRLLLTSPTGAGKSRMACELIAGWLEEGLRVVLYTNRKMLVEQLSGVLESHGLDHGVRAAGWEDQRHRALQVSSIQTENERVLRQQKWELHDAQRVVIDEAHLQKGAIAKKILDRHLADGASYLGLTATPLDLGNLYDELIIAGTNSELRRCGALVPCVHYGPDEPDTQHIKRQKSGDYSENDVRKVIMTSTIWARVFDWWKRLNPDARPAILFAPGVGESIWFAEQFEARGVPAAHIDGEEVWLHGKIYRSSRTAREDVLAGSRDGTVKVICNRFVLREGIDCPWLYQGIFATVYGSLQSYLQSGGRLLRAHPSLEHVILQDHGGNWWRHGSLNADRHWELNYTAQTVNSLREERLRSKQEPEPFRCPQCGQILSRSQCPCGFEVHRKSRPVVQKDGTLVEHRGDIYRERQTSTKPDTQKKWEACFWRCRRSGKTFRQAEGLFFHENGYWPPRDLPFMPTNEVDWTRRVRDVEMGALTRAH